MGERKAIVGSTLARVNGRLGRDVLLDESLNLGLGGSQNFQQPAKGGPFCAAARKWGSPTPSSSGSGSSHQAGRLAPLHRMVLELAGRDPIYQRLGTAAGVDPGVAPIRAGMLWVAALSDTPGAFR